MATGPHPHRAAAALTAAALLALTGCTGDGDPAPGKSASGKAAAPDNPHADAVRTAHDKTQAAGTARMAMRVQTTADGKSVSLDGQGVVDLAGGDSEMTLTADGEKVDQRVVGQVLYQKLPAKQRPGGKPWIKVDLNKTAAPGGAGGAQAGDPAAATAFAKAVKDDDVKKLGTERIGDANTTHYRVTVDVAKLQGGAKLKEQVGPTLPMDLWLDDAGRTRRQQFDMTLTAPEGTGADTTTPKKMTVRTVLELSDFGIEVKVVPPPPADTVDMTDRVREQNQKGA